MAINFVFFIHSMDGIRCDLTFWKREKKGGVDEAGFCRGVFSTLFTVVLVKDKNQLTCMSIRKLIDYRDMLKMTI